MERNPWAGIGVGALIERGHMSPPEPGDPGPFSMGNGERLRVLLEGAGFAPVRIEEVPVCFTFRDADEYMKWASETAGPFAQVIRGLSDGERRAIEVQLETAFASFEKEGGYELPGVSLNVVAS